MLCKVGLVLAMVLAAWLIEVRPAEAARLSPNNPYRSFNISGYNYGSMRWERTHGNRSQGGRRYGGLFFRRR